MTDWRENLNSFFENTEKAKQNEEGAELARFVADVALPAFEEIVGELQKHGREVVVRNAVTSAVLIVQYEGEEELTYRIQGRTFPNGVLPFAEVRFRERKGLKFIRIESMFRSGAADYALGDVTKEEIIRNFIENYTRRVKTP